MDSIPTRRTRDDERGTALIEFALVLPVLLLVFAGMFDLGMAFQRYQAVTNAAREGARMAVLPGYAISDVESRVTAYLTASGVPGTPTIDVDLPPAPTSITPPGGGAPFRIRTVRVRVTHEFTLLGPIATLVGGTFGEVVLTAESVMRSEVAGGI